MYGDRSISTLPSVCSHDEGYWAETSAIYINDQHPRGLHKRIIVGMLASIILIAISSNHLRHIKTS